MAAGVSGQPAEGPEVLPGFGAVCSTLRFQQPSPGQDLSGGPSPW